MATQTFSLGSQPFGDDIDNLTPWTSAVQLDSAFVAGGAEGWLRIFGPSGITWTVRVAPTPDGVAGIAGPELTDELEVYEEAFTLVAGDATFVARGPNHPDNLFADVSEPYTYNLGTSFDAFPTWFQTAGAAEVFLTIADGLTVIDGDAQAIAWAVAVPGATGEVLPTGDAQAIAWAVAVPGATGEVLPTGDAQAIAWAVAVPGATGVALEPVDGDAQALAWAVAVPGATGEVLPTGDAQAIAWAVAVPGATGVALEPVDGDAQALAWAVAVPGATGEVLPTGDAAALAWAVAVPGATGESSAHVALGIPDVMVAWGVYFESTGDRWWTGPGELVLAGGTWQPMVALDIEHAASELGAPARRAKAVMQISDPALRQTVLQDPGPLQTEVIWFVSSDRGLAWSVVPARFVGRLSNPQVADGNFAIEVETFAGDVDRGRPVKWSHERQMKRDANIDRGMEMANRLASGIETRWPP